MGDKLNKLKANLEEILGEIKGAYQEELAAGWDDLLDGVEAIKRELKDKQPREDGRDLGARKRR